LFFSVHAIVSLSILSSTFVTPPRLPAGFKAFASLLKHVDCASGRWQSFLSIFLVVVSLVWVAAFIWSSGKDFQSSIPLRFFLTGADACLGRYERCLCVSQAGVEWN
jgi:hypothetical protein